MDEHDNQDSVALELIHHEPMSNYSTKPAQNYIELYMYYLKFRTRIIFIFK